MCLVLRPKETDWFPEAGITDNCEHIGAGNQAESSAEATGALKCRAISPALNYIFNDLTAYSLALHFVTLPPLI